MGETHNEGLDDTFWRHMHENASERGGTGALGEILPTRTIGPMGESRPVSFRGQKRHDIAARARG